MKYVSIWSTEYRKESRLKIKMSEIHNQLKKRRKELRLKQEDMQLRVGMVRQQYQRLESKGNPLLDTLELVAKGLKMELMSISQEKLRLVRSVLGGQELPVEKSLSDDSWEGFLAPDY